ALVGTPQYMAPEQHAGRGAAAGADQFAFAASLFEALAGAPPFPGASVDTLRRAILDGKLRPLPETVPRWLARAVRRGLEIDPDRRFPSMLAFVAALE